MEKINDSVFGEMTYQHAWVKEDELMAFGRNFEVDVVAAAYTGEDIQDCQRDSYKTYKNSLPKYLSKIPAVLLKYYLDNYDYISSVVNIPEKINKENITKELIVKLIKVTAIYFDRNGQFGWLCDCVWDDEHGICILLSEEEISIKEQDFLF